MWISYRPTLYQLAEPFIKVGISVFFYSWNYCRVYVGRENISKAILKLTGCLVGVALHSSLYSDKIFISTLVQTVRWSNNYHFLQPQIRESNIFSFWLPAVCVLLVALTVLFWSKNRLDYLASETHNADMWRARLFLEVAPQHCSHKQTVLSVDTEQAVKDSLSERQEKGETWVWVTDFDWLPAFSCRFYWEMGNST